MYNKHNNCNIWLESMKLAVLERQSISQIWSKTQPIAACYDSDSLQTNVNDKWMRDH